MMVVRTKNDASIVERVLNGRREEFGELIRRYELAVRSIALARISAPDNHLYFTSVRMETR